MLSSIVHLLRSSIVHLNNINVIQYSTPRQHQCYLLSTTSRSCTPIKVIYRHLTSMLSSMLSSTPRQHQCYSSNNINVSSIVHLDNIKVIQYSTPRQHNVIQYSTPQQHVIEYSTPITVIEYSTSMLSSIVHLDNINVIQYSTPQQHQCYPV